MFSIDINCDVGEGIGNDAAIMPFISSANIACGFHAGDEKIMRETIRLAKQYNVAIGAHPSFHDKQNFGRTEMHLTADAIYDLVVLQVRGLDKIAKSENTMLKHVKPHGALYNMAARDQVIAAAIAQAVRDFNEELVLFGLANSFSIMQAKALDLRTASEAFADRRYQDDGSLVPRSHPGALIDDPSEVVEQVMQIINERCVASITGTKIPMNAETICIHGDGPHAIEFAQVIYKTLKDNNIAIKTNW